MFPLIDLLLTVAAGAVLLPAAYLVFLTVVALLARRRVPPPAARQTRFAVLVPAHNEALLIGRLLDSLSKLDYPRERYAVHVVADNCSDTTADIVRSYAGGDLAIHAHERHDETRKAKGYALQWLIARLSELGERPDAYVVLDADSVVSANFLAAMDARIEQGSLAIQAYYSVLNAGDSALAALRFAALAAIHYVRPLGRAVLGLSCGLKGNGMCFTAGVIDTYGWSAHGLAEDVEFHLALVRDGIRVDFAPEAEVEADMPVTFAQAASQNARWERGRVDVLRGAIARLALQGLARGSGLRLDAAIEQLIPPISVPIALSAALLFTAVVSGLGSAWVSLLALAGIAAYLMVGLAMVRAPWRVYAALAYAPVYVVWKAGLYAHSVGAVVTNQGASWVRTARR
jgi:1,2-diacylglycerol 3-beta-glucosyltransferase